MSDMNTGAAAPQDERKLFEVWAKADSAGVSLERDEEGDYIDMAAALLWHAWQQRAALPAQAAAPDTMPLEMQGIADALKDGGGFWSTCTGCHESNEGHPTGPFSAILKCYLGNGCSECGGIGAIWGTTDYQAMADHMAGDMDVAAPAQDVAPSDAQNDVCDKPPHGWRCTRAAGHDGPCAAVPAPEDIELVARGMDRLRAAGFFDDEPDAAPQAGVHAPAAQQAVPDDRVLEALDQSSDLLTAMLHEQRPQDEIMEQIHTNRSALNSAIAAQPAAQPTDAQDYKQAQFEAWYLDNNDVPKEAVNRAEPGQCRGMYAWIGTDEAWDVWTAAVDAARTQEGAAS